MLSPTGSTTIAAVIGSPVTHSLSPVIHNAAFQAMGIDWVYGAFEVGASNGAAAVEAMRTLGLGGLSVTMPLKAEVAEAVDELSPAAEALGAVNCVARSGHSVVGHNTDGAGFCDAFAERTGAAPGDLDWLVIGAGGAARAVIASLGALGAHVAVFNRTESRAGAAAQLAGNNGSVVAAGDLAEAVGSAHAIVNATSIGMEGTASAADVPIDSGLLRSGQYVADLVYHPLVTPLLRAASAAGAVPIGGVGMLVHQAAHQIRHWTGQEPPLDVIWEAVGGVTGV